MDTAIIAGHDSGLAAIITPYLSNCGWQVLGTSRRGVNSDCLSPVYHCDFSDQNSIDHCTSQIISTSKDWKVLVLSIGLLNPIGPFLDIDFTSFEASLEVNFINQMYFIHSLLNKSDLTLNRKVITFAGSGTNSAPINFSAYTLSKIALIKAMELLATEYPSQTFVSLGTGWMNTPIHRQTLDAGERAGAALLETVRRQESGDFGKTQLLLDFIAWILSTPGELITGRNFSLQGDDWQSREFVENLGNSSQTFKLRRMNQP
jgi:NAD(P)-dependent dehydrogenase (short-subunit alcohol dehydrogenase family)